MIDDKLCEPLRMQKRLTEFMRRSPIHTYLEPMKLDEIEKKNRDNFALSMHLKILSKFKFLHNLL